MGFIRFLLACIVVLWHTSMIFGYKPLPSDLAVQCFYVISGFYMSLVLNEKYPKGSHQLFYKNRFLKIYPLYWLVLVLLVLWAILVNYWGYLSQIWFYKQASPLSIGTWSYLIISGLVIIGLDVSFLLGIKDGRLFFTEHYGLSKPKVYQFSFNAVAWTIGVELLFYLIAPFIVRKRLFLILLILLGSLALRVVLANNGLSDQPWNYRFFPNQIMYFMGGCVSYRIYLLMKAWRFSVNWLKIQFIVLLSIILIYAYISDNSYYLQAFLFISLILLIPATFMVSKNNKLDRYLGNLSYPIYISQMLVINITTARAFPKFYNFGFTSLLATIALSMALYHFVTKPIERIRQSPFKRF